MTFATRTFLSSFVPVAILLALSFWAVRSAVIVTVREGLRASARENQVALTRERSRNEVLNQKLLQGISENPALKAGIQIIATERDAIEVARNTVEDQLSEIGDSLGFDYLMVTGVRGNPLAAVVRSSGGFIPVNAAKQNPPEEGIFSSDDRTYEVRSTPISEAGAQVARLIVGTRFDITRFGIPAVLLYRGKAVSSKLDDLTPEQIEESLATCSPTTECEIRIQEQAYLSLPLGLSATGTKSEYSLRSLHNVDQAGAPLRAVVQNLFLAGGSLALLAMLGLSAVTARSIARPLADLANRLASSAGTGELPEFPIRNDVPKEIRDLSCGFNNAAAAISESRARLTMAYVQFVGSLAQALDARDAYTAGHSRRVSEYSCAIASAMNLSADEIETIRVGALLHDLGKIGISDLVLQKPGRLSAEEIELIRQHPPIGRRILENVQGFESYVDIVELHHENWDGSGYPRGLKAEETPLLARIVKVADAYDAMTSDRPYRLGNSHAEAMEILRSACGKEFDTPIVDALVTLGEPRKEWRVLDTNISLQSLAAAISPESITESTRA